VTGKTKPTLDSIIDLVHAQAKAMLQAVIAWQQQQQQLGVSCHWAAARMALVSASRCGQPSADLHHEYFVNKRS